MSKVKPNLDLLITGFGPYPRVRVNPTEGLAKSLAASPRWLRMGLRVAAHVFETSYAAVLRELPEIVAERRPVACLHLGLAPRARWLRVETIGRGNPSRLAPDRRGRAATTAGDAKRPAMLPTTAPAAALLAAIRASGLPAKLSNQAGRYLCDTLYFTSLAENAGRASVVFVHLPKPTNPARRTPKRIARFAKARLECALADVALRLLISARRR